MIARYLSSSTDVNEYELLVQLLVSERLIHDVDEFLEIIEFNTALGIAFVRLQDLIDSDFLLLHLFEEVMEGSVDLRQRLGV